METKKVNTEVTEIKEKGFDSNGIVTCCLCGEKIPWMYSNNPWPLVSDDDEESRCCNDCNELKVLPARLIIDEITEMVEAYAATMRVWEEEAENDFEGLEKTNLLIVRGFKHIPEDVITCYQNIDFARWTGFVLGYAYAMQAAKANGVVNF